MTGDWKYNLGQKFIKKQRKVLDLTKGACNFGNPKRYLNKILGADVCP